MVLSKCRHLCLENAARAWPSLILRYPARFPLVLRLRYAISSLEQPPHLHLVFSLSDGT